MRFLTRSLVGLVLLSLTLGLLGLGGLILSDAITARNADAPASSTARERVYAASVMTLEPEVVTPLLTVFGEIRSRRTLELRASSAGVITALHPSFEEGGRVAAGEVLAQIDPADAETALQKARNDLAEARATLADAERSLVLATDDVAAAQAQLDLQRRALARQRDLLARGVGTEANVEGAELAEAAALQSLLSRRTALAAVEARIDQARTQIARREIEVAEAARDLEDTTLTAAFDGTLSGTAAVIGGRVAANEKLADLIDPTALEVAFRTSATQYLRLLDDSGRLRDTEVEVTLEVLGEAIRATAQLNRAAARVGEGQTGRLLFARLDDAPAFRPGDFVTVTAPEPPVEDAVVLPATAVAPDGSVLLLGAEDRLEVGRVEILRRQGDEMIVRVGGHAGREVVTERAPVLGAGIKVRPIRATPEGAVTAASTEMLTLDPDRRARLIAFVEGNDRMPAEAKARLVAQLAEDQVPAAVVARLESRMGS